MNYGSAEAATHRGELVGN